MRDACKIGLILAVSACAAPAPPTSALLVPAATRNATGPASTPLAPATDRERELALELGRDVGEIAGRIGERSSRDLWAHASCADTLARDLEVAGFSVQRQGYTIDDGSPVQNLEVQIAGGSRGGESVVIGAHYDSAPGSPGADDNASGVAAVLALARGLRTARPARTLRLVLLATELGLYWNTEQMGVRHYVRQIAARTERVVAVVMLDAIGYYSSPGRDDFLGCAGDEALCAQLPPSFSLPVHGLGQLADTQETCGAARAFSGMGLLTVCFTDTGAARNPHLGKASDTADRLDYGRMARAVAGIEQVVLDLANGP